MGWKQGRGRQAKTHVLNRKSWSLWIRAEEFEDFSATVGNLGGLAVHGLGSV